MAELYAKIDDIREKYRDYYQKYIAPGYYVVKAENLKEAKSARKEISYDLPLFKVPAMEYRIYREAPEDGESLPLNITSTLEQALDWFRTHPEETARIVVTDSSGDTVKIYSAKLVREKIENLSAENVPADGFE